jgi:hypothetical protein
MHVLAATANRKTAPSRQERGRSRLRASPQYPRPSYLPAGFVVTSIWHDYPGGFETSGEVVQYLHANGESERNGQMTFLAIYISPATTNRPAETQERMPERIMMQTGEGEVIEVEYYDGAWQGTDLPNPPAERMRVSSNGETLLWNTENCHSVLFTYHGYSIYIQGCRHADVDRNQLIEIARSFSEQRISPIIPR